MLGGFRKKSKRGNIRQKITTESDGEDENNDLTSDKSAVQELKHSNSAPVLLQNKVKIKKNSSVLSFNDELNNGEEFVVRKSKASLNLVDQMKKEKKKKKKKEKVTIENEDNEINTVTEKLPLVTSSKPIIKTFTEDELEEDNLPRFSVGSRHFGGPGDIPDAATIYAMKKKREQARQFGEQVNYIPLSSNKIEGRYGSDNSRLVREDMEDDSSDEERIEMKGSTTASHPSLERRKQVAKALEEANDDIHVNEKGQEEDEELQNWENEQIKKGSQIPTQQPQQYGPRLPLSTSSCTVDSYITYSPPVTQAPAYKYTPLLPPGYAPQMYSAMYSIPGTDNQVHNVDMVIKKLREHLDTKKQLFRLHEQEKEKTKFNFDSSKDNILDLKVRNGDLSDKFEFYQDIRGFVKDLCECLNEKVKKINNAEKNMHESFRKKTEKLIARRLNDVKDEADEVGGKTNNDSEKINNIRNRRIAEREGRRQRRKEKRIFTKIDSHYDGMSSDEELLASDSLRFAAEKDKILSETKDIFEDVISDFTSIKEIMSRFEQWKFGFSESYKDAYLSDCLPKLFTPFIKLELLAWNPLEIDNSADFEGMNWYKTLALYGDHSGEFESNDEDLKLLPNIIEKVLIPKLTDIVRDAYDPLSSKQTKLLVFLFQRLVDDYPTITKSSKRTQALVECIVAKLKIAIDSELYIPLYPQTMLETRHSRALAFLERQFWKSLKLLANIMIWNWMLSRKQLQQLGVDAIINRYLIIALQQFPDYDISLDRAKMVINSLPKEWFEKSDQVVPGLESFARYLKSLASNVYKSSLGYSETSEKKKAILSIKKIIAVLMHIQAFDDARAVANAYKEDIKKEIASDSPIASPVIN